MKMNDYDIVDNINKLFGTSFRLSKQNSPNNLPLYLHNERKFYLLSDNDEDIILVETDDNQIDFRATKVLYFIKQD